MWLPITIALALTLLLSLYSVNKFIKLSKQPLYLTAILTLSLFLPFSIIFLLPIDLISTSTDNDSNGNRTWFYLSQATVMLMWRLNYWTTFVLTWCILPFYQYWFNSGYFKKSDRFRDSVIQLIKFQMIMLACGIIALLYIIIKNPSWLNFQFLKSLVITISHIYALVVALWLMAYGLIYLPRHSWEQSGGYENRLHNAYLKVPELKQKLEDTKFDLKELCGRLKSLSNLDNLEYRDWIIKLVDQIPENYQTMTYHGVENFTNDEINSKLLNKLTIQLKHLKWDYNHNEINFNTSIEKVVELEDRVNAHLLGELNLRAAKPPLVFIKNPKINYYVSQFVQPTIGKLFTLILIGLTILIIQSEIFHGLKFSLIKLIIRGLTQQFNQIYVQVFAVSFIVLTYMLVAAMISLAQVKIFNIYHIESNQSSDPVSTVFFISYACRLTIPLSYNFLMLLDSDFTKNSSFQKFLGNSIQLISLGNFLNDMLPRLLLIPILLTYFRIWEKLKRWLSGVFLFDYILNEFDFEDEEEIDLNNAQDVESGAGGTNSRTAREVARVHEAKLIIQRTLNSENNTTRLNNSTPFRSFTLAGLNSSTTNVATPLPRPNVASSISLASTKNMIGGLASRVSSFGRGIFGRRSNNYQSQTGYENLRSYNLGMDSNRESQSGLSNTSRISSESGISLNTNHTFDTDNRLLRDDDIMLIDEDEDDDYDNERIIL